MPLNDFNPKDVSEHVVAKWSKAVMLITLSFIEINRDVRDHFEG
jgi:hypothetical protein